MAKSIIEIEIQDGQWKKFSEQVKGYQEELKKMPGQWGAVGKSLATVQGVGAKFLATIKENAKQFKEANTPAGKMILALKASDRMASSLARNTLTVARNMKDATKSLLSWGSIMGLISGVLGAGGLFGIARMAASVSTGQSNAMRSGSTYGGSKAAGIAYSQLLGGEGGVQSLLEKMRESQGKGGFMFGAAGMSQDQWKGKEASDILPAYLAAVKKIYESAPESAQQLVREQRAPDIEAGAFVQLSKTNLDQLEKTYESNKRALELSQGTQDAYANFSRQLDSAGEKIQNVFVKGLTPLIPGLTKLSDAVVEAIATIMGSDFMKGLIKGSGKAIDDFAKYLTTEFPADLKSFIEELQKIGKAMQDTAAFLSKWLGENPAMKAGQEEIKKRGLIATAMGETPEKKTEMQAAKESFNGMSLGDILSRMVSAGTTITINNNTGGNVAVQAHATAR